MKGKVPTWVLRETVVALQGRLLAEFGGAAGIRDAGMLESALSRPENRFASEDAGVSELAAAYAFGLVRNHPFVDGNKRIGFATAVVFLRLNQLEFTASESDAVIQTLALAAGALDESGYATWLKKNSRKASARKSKR